MSSLRRAFAMVLLSASTCATACSRDEEAEKLFADMKALQKDVTSAMESSPDEAGVAQAEALVAKNVPGLRTRFADLSGAKLSPGVVGSTPHHCSQNHAAASIGRAYVTNGLWKRQAAPAERERLLARVERLEKDLGAICE